MQNVWRLLQIGDLYYLLTDCMCFSNCAEEVGEKYYVFYPGVPRLHDSSDFMKHRGLNGIFPDSTKFPVKLTSFHNRSQKKLSFSHR